PPFYEKGIEAALRKVLREKRFSVVETMKEAIGPSAVVFLCVGTPSRPDGSMDDSALREAVKSVAEAWQDGSDVPWSSRARSCRGPWTASSVRSSKPRTFRSDSG